jgi:hypothetical protein
MLSDAAGDEYLVRSITATTARRLAAAEVGALVRSMQAAVEEQKRQQDGGALGGELW